MKSLAKTVLRLLATRNSRFAVASRGEAGQTMIDLLVALTLLALALGSAGALATAATRSGNEAGRRTQATMLAGRELDAFRNYRDSVAKLGQPWAGIPSGNCNPGNGANFIMQRGSSNGSGWSLVAPSDGSPVAYSDADEPNYSANYGGFSRLVTLCDMPGNINAKTVQVKVYWDESSGQRQVTFSTMITNWRLQ